MSEILRLSDILGRGVPIEWYEAVAVVREVADRVRDSAGGRAVPELDQVQLAFDGAVSITGTTRTDEPVRRLGQLLQACLVQAEPPVQLRLVVAQATAPDPAYPSIRDYSEALAYFERPDRSTVLQNLYARANAAPASATERLPTLDVIAPLEAPAAASQQKVVASARGQVPRGAVFALAAAVVLIVAATAYSQFHSATPVRQEVSSLAIKATDAVGTTLVKGISAVSETVGLGRLVPAAGSGAPAPAPKPSITAPKTIDVRAKRSASRPPAAGLRVFDLAVPPVVVVAGVPDAVATGEFAVDTPIPVPIVGTEAIDTTVYSSDDTAVAPPIGVRPQLPRVLPEDVRRDQLSQIELIVLPDGTVGSVKLLGGRRNVLEGMLLSAAKAWKFRPAEKDGRPVAYRKTVWLVLE
jgi:hypothetical protein